jgi:hypothetical protein
MGSTDGFFPVLLALCLSLLASLMTMLSYLSTRDVFHQRMVFVLTVFSVLYTASYLVYMVGTYEVLSDRSGFRLANVSVYEQPLWLKIALVVAVMAEMIFIAWTGCISHFCVHNAKYRALKASRDFDFDLEHWEIEVEKKYIKVTVCSCCLGLFCGVGYFSYKHGGLVSECTIGVFRIVLGIWIFHCTQVARKNAHRHTEFASKAAHVKALSSLLLYYVLSQVLSIAIFVIRLFTGMRWNPPTLLQSMSWAMNDIFPFFNTFVWGANRHCVQSCLQKLLIPSESPWSERRQRANSDSLDDYDEEGGQFMKKSYAPLLPDNPTNEMKSPVEHEAGYSKGGNSPRLNNAIIERSRQSSERRTSSSSAASLSEVIPRQARVPSVKFSSKVETQIINVREPVVSLSCCTWSLFFLVGLGPWLLVNGMLVESACFVSDLPRGSEFPAIFGGAVQLGNIVGVILLTVRRRLCYMSDPAAGNAMALMHAMLILALVGCLLLAISWRQLPESAGHERALAVLVCAFIGGLVGRMSKTALLSLCAMFNFNAKSAISVGVSVSGLVPVLVGVLQYAPKKTNGPIKHFERFGVTESMYYISCFAGLAYAALLLVHKGGLAREAKVVNGGRTRSGSRSRSNSGAGTGPSGGMSVSDRKKYGSGHAGLKGAAATARGEQLPSQSLRGTSAASGHPEVEAVGSEGGKQRGILAYEFHPAMAWPLANLIVGAVLNCSVVPGMLPFLAQDVKVEYM